MAEREEELNSLLTRVKESEKAGLKLNIQKTRVKEESEKAGLKLNIQKLRSWHPVMGMKKGKQ